MANIVPPLLSDTPPPPPQIDDQEDDEFGDFHYQAEDTPSPPGTPLQLPTLDENVIEPQVLLGQLKDYCDKRKSISDDNEINSNSNKIDHFEAEFDPQSSNKIDDFDDFGDFAEPQSVSNNDDFGNSVAPQNDDDFDDFASFTAPTTDLQLLLLNDKEALEKASIIIKEMFPEIQQSLADFQDKYSIIEDRIFDQIKNVTETHALSFQWPKSASQNLLLKSLNIDSRNILGWNPSMPKYASNLSFTPLEPVKSEILTPIAANLESLPNSKEPEVKKNILESKLKPPSKTVVLRETHISTASDIVSWLEPTIVTPELARKERPYVEEEYEDFQVEVKQAEADDFGDFAYSLPQLLEPLKPSKPETTTSINWPDPGITDDEIGRLEALGLARNKPKPLDDEWTDFVSSQKSPLHKVRCATPDLPLSVLNLPIPVITPNGLVQTKLSTNKVKIRTSNLNIISNQYADQAFGDFNQYASSKVDDEEWSDFVSHEAALPDLDFSGARK